MKFEGLRPGGAEKVFSDYTRKWDWEKKTFGE
jgi:hypothetical protein